MVLVWYLVNVIVLAFPLAILEIWLEKFKSGRNGEFYHPFWGKKIHWRPICILMQKRYVTPYHLLMFGVVMPALLVGEYLCWRLFLPQIQLVPIIFWLAVWLGVATLEDFLFFLLNWRDPDYLWVLLRGGLSWHTKWIRIGEIRLPEFYVTVPLFVIFLFLVQNLLLRSN